MHILTVHCQYQQRGGEDCVYETESKLLRTAGNLVTELTLSNHEIDVNSLRDKVLVGARTIWSRKGKRALARTIGEASPDIVHFHNTFPLLSPSVYYACAEAGVPCVQTLHNYRLLCANAMLVRDGNVCERCLGGRFFSRVRYSCYRESRAASSAVVAMQYVHLWLGTFAKKVDRFIALMKFAREKFATDGIPLDKLVIKPNSLDMDPGEGSGDGGYALFVGRLSTEKDLLGAFGSEPASAGRRLTIC